MLDSTNPGGFSAGSIDATQFAWLEEALKARSARHIDREGKTVASNVQDRLIVVASHHSSAAMNNPFSSPDQGERVRGPQLEELLHRFPNVVLQVMPKIRPVFDPLTSPPSSVDVSGALVL